MFLVVGLGNPGSEYANTRHNVGFMAADAICSRYNFESFKKKFDGEAALGQIAGEKVLLLKPHTYMNLSGNAVVKAALFYKILPENIIVIHDDMDLKIGQLKAKLGGGSGGHNGLKSIDAHISPNYNRIRIGVGHPQNKGADVVNYVLGSFSKEEKQVLENNLEIVTEAVEVLIKNDVAACSNFLGMATKNK
ncbi:MAG: aminoacyl-tRNA hydrolase [Alphaproteobacteria bacterium]|nr:aminoacyl-tRNA hydrolase [Alphaproteobacteria bacterium]